MSEPGSFRIKLKLGAETFTVVLSENGADRPDRSARLGYCEITEREIDRLRSDNGSGPLDQSLTRAVLNVKKILGGEVVEHRTSRRLARRA